jgi:hypothetical protein
MEEYASYKKHCFIDSFGNSITDEVATILATMNTQSDRHSILHISKTNFYDKKNAVKHSSDGRKTCTNIYTNDKGDMHKCTNLRGYWWCVECTYKNPLAPVFLCSECANINIEQTTTEQTIFTNIFNSRCHYNNPQPISFYDQKHNCLKKKRKVA